jgi:hypothetical protein
MKRASAWPWAAAGLVAGVVVGPAAPAWAQDSKVLAGYWEGKGTIWDRPLDDAVRKLTRRSETTFWFACDKQLRCRGEATTTYAADLQAVKWSIPLPSGAIEAAVAGSSEKTTLTYPIEGTIADRKLQLRVVGEAADLVVPNAAFEFVLTATATLPATGAIPSRAPSMQIIKIPAKAWSPFQQLEAPITKRPQGPYVAAVKKAGEKFSIEWYAQRTPAPDLDGLANEVIAIIEPRLREQLRAALEAEIKAEVKRELETEVRARLETELKAKLEAELKPRLEAELKAKLEAELKAKLEAELKPKLEAELKAKLAAELKAELEAHLRVLLASLPESPGAPGGRPAGGTTPAGGSGATPALPDLVPTVAAATATGGNVIVHDAVRNQGPADAGPFAVTFYLSRDAVLDGNDIPFCSRTVPGLKGGGTGAAAAVSEARTTCAWPAGATGSYHVIVVVDSANAVLEASDTNNLRATGAIRKP